MKRQITDRLIALAGTLLIALCGAIPARAQDPDDLPRGVARISLMNGEVSVRRGDSGEWVAGVVNAPLMTDDRIATGLNSRAEVQFDSANILRIGGNAEVRLAQVEAGAYHLELAKGTVTFRVLRTSSVNVELSTPSVSLKPSREGTYRVTVDEAGESEITARAGDVEVFTPKGSQWVANGQTMLARGNPQDPEFQMISALPLDDWDRWNEQRDRSLLQSNSYQYVPQGVYGAEDLDGNGSWTYVSPYGYVWRPTVTVADWSPYRYGRWVWEDWYGWVWVSTESWGWAPYHYGRWFFQANFGWCWYPGVFGVRHYWAPGLVAFFGYGGFGHVGWVPLAPYEVFHPWWGRGFYSGAGFNRNINIANVNITNTYRNARVNGGVMSVRAEDFRAGRFGNIQRPGAPELHEASLVRGQMPIAGSAQNRRFSDRTVANVPRSSDNQHFFSRQNSSGAVHSARPANGAATNTFNGIRPSGTSQPQNGFRRFGEAGASGAGRSPAPGGGPASTSPGVQQRGSQSVGAVPPTAVRNEGIRRFGEAGSGNQTTTPANNSRPGNWNSFNTRDPGSGPPPARQSTPPPQSQPNRIPAPAQGPGRGYSPAPAYNTPRQASPGYGAPRQSAPAYNAPRPSAPARQSAPSAPRSAPPSGGGHSNGGGGGGRGGGRR